MSEQPHALLASWHAAKARATTRDGDPRCQDCEAAVAEDLGLIQPWSWRTRLFLTALAVSTGIGALLYYRDAGAVLAALFCGVLVVQVWVPGVGSCHRCCQLRRPPRSAEG